MIPAADQKKGTSRLSHLREYLQSQGRLREARAILDQELAHVTDGAEQRKACESLLEACFEQAMSEEPIWWITSTTRIRLGKVLSTGHHPEAGDFNFQQARRTLKRIQISDKENNAWLLVRLVEIGSLPNPRHEDILHAYEEFLQSPKVRQDEFVYSNTLTRATSSALEILESDTSPRNQATFWKWYNQTESNLKNIGYIAYLSTFRVATGDIACSLFAEWGAILKWHEEFEKTYPLFRLWGPKTDVGQRRLLTYNYLKDEKRIFQTIMEMKDIADDQDDFWYEAGFMKQGEVSRSSVGTDSGSKSIPAAFQPKDVAVQWLSEWSEELSVGFHNGWASFGVSVGSDAVKLSTMLENHLCSWIKRDFRAGILTAQDLRGLLFAPEEGSDLFLAANVTHNIGVHQIESMNFEDSHEAEVESSTVGLGSHSIPRIDDRINTLSPESLSLIIFGSQTSPTSDSRWEEIYLILSKWLLLKSDEAEDDRHFLLYNVQSRRLSNAISSASSYKTRGLEAYRLIDLIPKLSEKVQHHVSSNSSSWKSTVAAAKRATYIESHGHPLLDMDSPELKEIIGLYDQCLAENRGSTRLLREVHLNMSIASVYLHAAKKLDPKALSGFFNAVEKAVEAFEKIREGWRILTGWDRVQKLLLALEDQITLQIAPLAITVACQIPITQREARDKGIWSMIQFAKSIGIGWLLESNAADGLSHRTEGTSDNRRILCEAADSEVDRERPDDHSGSASPEALPPGHDQADTKSEEDQAGNHSNFDLSIDRMLVALQAINRSGADAVFVDWFNTDFMLDKSSVKPVIATLTGVEEGPKCCLADTTWQEVNDIIDKFMDLETEELQDKKAKKLLYKLNPLVKPLSWTKPGQTLVFSPCGNLHRIPLHALKIDGEVLIKRNPIVYCSSMSALVVAFQMRKQKRQSTGPPVTPAGSDTEHDSTTTLSFKASLYADPPSDIGNNALETVATRFKAKPHRGPEFTTASFTQTIEDPDLDLLHYHGHADFSPTEPMDHSLLFSDCALTLRNIFDLPPPSGQSGGFHATLLGCGSGISKAGPTSDVLGLVPSLLHAGASSTISTLWRFSDEDAAAYSDSFYERFEEVKTGDGLVDLARVNQRAVLSIMEKRPALYHWGSFVLNGCWLMGSPHRMKGGRETQLRA